MNGRDELSAESHYLNALEALDGGDRDRAIKEAQRATNLDPDHLEAWSVYVDACLPAGVAPSMKRRQGSQRKLSLQTRAEWTCGSEAAV